MKLCTGIPAAGSLPAFPRPNSRGPIEALCNHAHGNGEATGGTISVFGPHAPVGTTSFILEFNGQTELQGDRVTLTQLLTGFAYTLTDSAELRFAVDFPLNHRELQMDRQYTFGFQYMF